MQGQTLNQLHKAHIERRVRLGFAPRPVTLPAFIPPPKMIKDGPDKVVECRKSNARTDYIQGLIREHFTEAALVALRWPPDRHKLDSELMACKRVVARIAVANGVPIWPLRKQLRASACSIRRWVK